MTETFVYAGRIVQDDVCLHIWMHLSGERSVESISMASADLYNIMIQEGMIGKDDNVIMFDARGGVLFPTQTYHAEFRFMRFVPDDLTTIWNRIVSAERDDKFFIVTSEFRADGSVYRHTYEEAERPGLRQKIIALPIYPDIKSPALFATTKELKQ